MFFTTVNMLKNLDITVELMNQYNSMYKEYKSLNRI